MPDGTADQQLLYAVAIDSWGSVCDYVNCVRESADPSYVPQTCPTLSSTSTTSTSTTTTALGCKYPTNSSQVGLVVFDEEPRNGDAEEIGLCSCDVGKKAFYNSGSSAVPTGETSVAVFEYRPDEESGCADFCVIDEAGDECRVSPDASLTIWLKPYCVEGKCHTYVWMSGFGDETSHLICGSRNFTLNDELDSNGDWIPMHPNTSPQAYAHAAAFTCKGCAAIRNSSCLKTVDGPTTTTPAVSKTSTTTTTTTTATASDACAPLLPNQVGLTRCKIIIDNTTQASDSQGICQCINSWAPLKRQFWTSADSANPSEAMTASQMATTVECGDVNNLCIVSETGAQCIGGTGSPSMVQLIPYCAGTDCHLYVIQQGPELASLECDDGSTFFLSDQVDASGNLLDMGAQTPYVRAQSVCCDGCIPLEDVVCMGPTVPDS